MFAEVLLLTCAALCQAEASDPAALQLKVNRLVRQLDADDLAERVAAEKSLVEIGPKALDLLPAITPRTSAEVKDRLGRVRTILEKQAAEQAAEASRVTLQGEMTLAEAMAALEKQTGNKVVDVLDATKQTTVKTDFEEAPYWEALDSLLAQAGLAINTYGGNAGALTAMSAPEGQRPRTEGAAYGGVFRFEPLRIESVRNLRNPDVQQMRLTLEISWEPRVTPLSLEQPLDAVTATAEGGTLTIDNTRGSLTASTHADISSVELEIPFELPSRDVKEIQSLQGTVTALVPGLTETYVFENIHQARGVENRKAGVTVVLDQVRKNQDLYEVRMRVRLDDAGSALASHLSAWIFSNEAYLEDASGKKVENIGQEGYLQASNEVGMVYRFDLQGSPAGYKFVYKTPAAIVETPVEYELKNIPLP
ncbi:MAG: hypothetical protein KY475_01370 [Planctomycetes bacterium]|nr:hypothetical protein [Planctomycetota bacterium]